MTRGNSVRKGPPARRRKSTRAVRPVVLVGTRKGAWLLHGDATRRTWRADGPHFLGQIINHLVLDPRDGKTLLRCVDVVDDRDFLRKQSDRRG